jgi:uncharacterized repeat protein (TIGR03803 family)
MPKKTKRNRTHQSSKRVKNTRQVLIEAIEPRFLMSTSWTVSDVADFNGTNGENPLAGVYRDSSGNLWGTTYGGGSSSDGTIYKVAAGTSTVTTVLNFNGTNGSGPWGDMVADSSGNIYGTTSEGGAYTYGTVYKIAAGTNTVTTLDSFNGTDGAYPDDGLFLDSSGNLWGTTESHGANGVGTVFKIASGSSTISLVNSFSSATGSQPYGGLIVDSSGNVYGTTTSGGSGVGGTVFEIPSGSSNINVLAAFSSSSGSVPYGGLVRDSSGNLYGTTTAGGANSDGTVFELVSGGNTITPLVSFNGTNGSQPRDPLLIDSSGNLYGTTYEGGASNAGTAFEIVNGTGTVTTLASFIGTTGNGPEVGKLVMDSAGNLYGTTWSGGANSDGNIFEVTPHVSSKLGFTSGPTSTTAGTSQSINVSVEDTGGTTVTTDTSTVTLSIASGPAGGTISGTTSVAAVAGVATFSGITFSKTGTYTLTATASNLTSATSSAFAIVPSYTFTDVADFNGSNGENPLAGLYRDSSGNLWGTTYNGGTYGYGTIYKIAAGTNTITNIFNFNGTDGRGPWENLIADSSDNLYGTTSEGGAYGYGEVYKITAGTNTVTTLASFNFTNGNSPQEGLVLDSSGNLWGTANTGGANNDGGVFKISTAGGAISLVASFNSSTGANPIGGLVIDSSGNVYGITNAAGSGAGGTIYEISSGGSSINVLASFTSTSGYGPYGALVRDSNGNLYGTTTSGGANSDGTVYELTSGGNTITPLASFNGTEGSQPRGSLLMDSGGNLYGTTYAGGANGDGTAFELVNGTGTIAMLASFNGTTGNEPWDNLTMDSSGNLYGTTWSGGANSDGNIFELTPHVSSKLGFTSGPVSTTAGTSQSINVSVEDAAGATVTTDTSTITLAIASGPTGGTISGTTSVAAVNGVATFSGLTFSTPGAYTLTATASNLTSATSSSFTIVPSYTQIKLADLSNSLGKYPSELVADSSGNMYGVTNQGGANGVGAVYKIAAGTHAVSLFASFSAASSTSGAFPQAGLTFDSSGNMWGTTSQGGIYSAGVIFKIAAGSSTISTVASLPQINGQITAIDDSMAIDSSGNLYGASIAGGDGFVFELPANSSTVSILHSFSGSDGIAPAGSVVLDSSGNLYGTTANGGANGDGTVFKISHGSNTLTTLVNFNSTNGASPEDTPILDSSGNLYGTTYFGGPNNDGTVWEIPAGSSTLNTLATFNGTNGQNPYRGRLIIDSSGNLYGTTNIGGSSSDGNAWVLPSGTGTIVPIANFNNTTGYNPQVGLLMDSSGNLFGATTSGAGNGYGAVYELTASAATGAVFTSQPTTVTAGASQSFTVKLESVNGFTDTSNTSTVTLSIASGPSGGTIGGTTSVAAVNGVANFSGLTFTKAGTYTLTASANGLTSATSNTITVNATTASKLVITQQPTTGSTYHTFGSIVVNVEDQYGNVVTGNTATVTLSSTTTLSGTTSVAAVAGVAMFSYVWTAASGNFTFTAASSGLTSASTSSIAITAAGASIVDLASFSSSGGNTPYGIPVVDSSGNLWGTTNLGGTNNLGTVWELPAGSSTINTIASFSSSTGGNPQSAVVMDAQGNLFGTTCTGGTNGYGTVWEVAAGTSTITPLMSFAVSTTNDSWSPLSVDAQGNIYGTVEYGGTYNHGIIYKIVPSTDTVTTLTNFNASSGYAWRGVTPDSSGNLFGVEGYTSPAKIFELPVGSSTITLLANAPAGNPATDNTMPLVVDSNGNIFGSTLYNGVYELPHGASTITTIASSVGGVILDGMVMDSHGNLFGTEFNGGTSGQGTVYEIPAGSIQVTTLGTFNGTNGAHIYVSTIGNVFPSVTTDGSGNLFGVTPGGGANSLGVVYRLAIPGQATFSTQPATVTAGASQNFTINLTNYAGTLDTTNQSPVTLAITSGPSGGTIGGTVTVNAVNGVASFSGITFNKAGTYILSASSTGVASTNSTTITVTAGAAAKVVFTTQPAGAMSGNSFGAVVSVEDTFGNVVTTDSSTVSLTVTDGTALHGTTSVQAVNGVATFTNLSINPLGSRTLNASDGSLTGAVSSSFTISALTTTITGLAQFTNTTGYTPSGNIVRDSAGNMFGTARYGGANSRGTVWEVAAGTTTITTFASFSSSTGSTPYGGLTIDSAGDLFGTTYSGGTSSNGTVFEIAHGTSTITTLASFNSTNGANPYDTVYIDSAGNLYGTAYNGGANGDGTVWKIANGSNTITTIASLNGTNGSHPMGTVVMDSSGDLFSTAKNGGSSSDGTVFEIASGSSTISTLVSFNGSNGSFPEAGLVIDSSGNLYGTTLQSNGWGTAFEIAAGTNTLTTLGTMLQYTNINTPLTLDANGNLFGTAYMGGVNSDGSSTLGAIFEIPAGTSTVNTLGSFAVATNGKLPLTNAVVDSSGNIFTTASTDNVTNQGYLDEIVALPPATQVVFNTQPTNAAAGTSQTFTANIETATGVVLASSSTGTLSIASGPAGATLGGTTTVTDTNGTLTFSGITFTKPGNYTLTLSVPGLPSINTNTIIVTVGAANKTVFTQVPSSAVAGQTVGTVIVQVTDSVGNLIAGSSATVTLSGTGVTGTLSATAVGGVATFNNVILTASGSRTITASSGGLNAGISSAITVSPSVATKLGFITQPVNTVSGQSIGTVTVGIEDTYGNIVPTDNSTVTLSVTDGSTLSGTTSVQAVNGVATFTGLSINALGTHTLHAVDGSFTAATSSGFTISALAPYMNALTGFNTSTGTGASGNIFFDSNGNLWGTAQSGGANNRGTVWEVAAGTSTITPFASFSSSTGSTPWGGVIMDSAGNLFGTTYSGGTNNYGTVFEIVNGTSTITTIATFNNTNGANPYDTLYIDSSGNLYGTTYAGGANSLGTVFKIASGSNTITTIASFNGTNGSNPMGGVVMDSSGDLFGTTRNGGSSSDGTVFEIASGTSTISTLVTFNGTNGSNPEAGLTIDSTGNLYGSTYYYSSGAGVFKIAAGTSTLTTIALPQYTHMQIGGLMLDGSGNLFGTSYEGGVYSNGNGYTEGAVFEIPSGSSTSVTLASFLQNTSGMFPLTNVVMDSSGNLFTTSSYSGTGSNSGELVELPALPAATQVAFITQPTTAVAGVSQTITASIESSTGAILASSSQVTLSIASGPTGGTLGGTLTVTDTNGVATFSGITFNKVGTYTLTVSAPGLTSATSTTITVTAGAASKAVVAQVPSTATAGQTLGTVIVDITDAGGNLITNSTATVTLSGTGLTGTLSVAAVGGVATFNNLIMTTAGSRTITAAVSGLTSGTSSAITVSAGIASKVAFTTQPSSAGSSQSLGTVAVSVEDTYGNVVTTDNSTVTLTTSDGSPLNGTTSVAAVNGVATFTNLSINVLGSHTLHAVDGSLTAATSNSITISAESGTIAALASFNGTNGANPYGAMVIDSHGNLFGTTQNGGANLDGTVFEIAAGSGTITTIASFNSSTGTNPWGQLMIDSAGDLYGTTNHGGVNSDGTVFEVVAGSNTITKIADFSSTAGTFSTSGLIEDSSGNLYGTTNLGGANSDGTIYKIASGTNTITVLASFNGTNGSVPRGGVVMDASGNLYGTATNGGAYSGGTIWKLANGSSTITTLASFNSSTGTNPYASLVMDSSGNLYGTTYGGNSGVFEVAAGTNTITPLGAATGISTGQLLMDSSGNLFGTTVSSGTYSDGTVFEITAGSRSYLKLADLNGTNGSTVQAGLVMDSSGNLYGDAYSGGANSDGTVFEVTPPASVTQAVFTSQPTNVTAGASQSFNVSLESAGGAVIAQGGTVTLSIASGSTGATLGGTLTATATNGVATFSGITFTKAGTYTLTAASSGLTSATSTAITVNPAAASKVAFLQTPTSGTASSTLGTVQVAIEDTYGNTVTSSTATVTITGSNLSGTTSAAAVAGVATFNNLILTTPGAYTLTAASGGVSSATTPSFTISRGVASKLVFAQQPTGASAGGSIGTVKVDVTDSVGNIVTTDNSAVTLTITDGSAITGTATVNAVNGVATFTGLSVNASGTHILSASDGSLTGALSNSFTMTIGAASRLVVIQQPGNITAGQTVSAVQVAIEDAHGNIVTSNTSIVTLTAAGVTGTLTQTAVNGVATFSDLSFTAAGNHTLAFADSGLTSVNSSSFTVTAAAPSQLVIAQQPTSSVAGQSIGTVIVDVKDAYGNIVTGNTSAVTLYTGSAITGTTTVNAVNGVATFTGLSIHQAGTYTLSATQNGLTSATSSSITITPAAASQLVMLQQPAAITTAGQNIGTVVVNVEDQFGNIVTNDTSTVTVATSTTLTGTTSANAVNGVATLSGISIHQAGSYSLTATDGSLTSASSSSFTIVPAAASKLAITQQPTGATVGQAIGTMTVQVQDTYGNLVNTDNSTVSVTTSDSTPLSGVTSVQAVNGIATFSGLSTTVAGTRTLTVTDGSMTSATSSSLTITPSTATHLVITQQPTDTAAGSSLPTVIVQVEDQFGNVVAGDTSTVTLSTSAALNGTTSVAAVNGVATFTGLSINTIGNYSLSATDGSLAGTATNNFNITPGVASQLVITQQPIATRAGQTIGNVTAQVEDAFGNLVSTDSSTLTLAVTDGATLNGVTSATAVNGVATFTGLWCPTAGAHTLTVSDGSLTPATSNSFTVVAADPTQLVIAQQPSSSTVAGQSIGTVIVNVEDAFNNVVANDNTTVTLTSDDGSPILGSTSVAAVNGVATFTGLALTEAGTHALFATDGNYRFGETSSFTITPAAASQLVFNQQPTAVNAGQAMGTISVNVEDAFGNLVTTNSSTVSMVVSSGATLGGTTTAVASGGVATFTGLSINQAGVQSLFASDGSLTPATSNSFAVNQLAATKLAFVQQPTNTVAGQTLPVVQVNVEDIYGNLVTSDNSSTVTLYSGAAINGTTSVTAVNGVALFSGLSLNRAGSYTLSATNGNLAAATSSSFTITASTANQLVFAQQPNASTVAGQSIGTIHVDVEDQYGNLVTTDSSTVTLSSSATLIGTTTATASGGVATFSGLSIHQAGSYTLAATDSGATTATSNSFAITPAAASQLVFAQQPTNTTVGFALNTITVNVEDQYGNIVTGNQSTVTLTAGAAISGVTSVAAVNGVATFTGLSMTTAVDQRMHAFDGGLTSATSNWFSTLPAATSQLVVTQQPGNAVAGQSIGTVVVQAKDAYGNVVTGSGTPLNGTAPDTADVGNAVWTANPNITTDGSEVNVEADEDATLPFVPTPGHVYVLSASMNPQAGNTTNWLGMGFVTLSTPPGTYGHFNFVNNQQAWLLERDNRQTQAFYGSTGVNGPTAANLTGYDSYAITLDTTGSNWTVSFAQDGTVFQTGTFSSNPAITGISIGNYILAGSFRNLSLTQDGTAIYNDQFARGSAPTVTLSTSSGAAISGQTTAQFINGKATFTGLSIDQAGDYTLSATQGSVPSVSTNNIIITPAAASQLVITQQPTNTIAGQSIGSMVVDVEDAFGNIVTTDSSNITLSSTTPVNGTLSVTADQGVATFSGLSIDQAGSYTLSATDGNLTPASSNSISITAAAAAQLAFAQQPANAAATQSIGTVVVDVEDIYGNVVTTDSSNVALSIVGGTALNGTTTHSAVGGVATFSGLSVNPAGTYSLSAADGGLTAATSNSFTIATGAATQLVVAQQPTDTVAGQTISPIEVDVEDAGGNVVTTDNSSITVAGDAAVAGTFTISAFNGVAMFSDLSMTLAGSHELSFTDGSLTGVSSNPFSITPAASAQLVFQSQPSSALQSHAIDPFTVEIEDAYGNLVTSNNSTVTMATTDGTPVGGTFSVNSVGGVATFSNLTINRPGSKALLATDGALNPATSSAFPVTPSLTTLTLTVPATSVTVGQTLQFTASGTDGAGAPIVLDPVTWSLDAGSVGSIDQNGLFNAGSITSTGGTAMVRAACDGQTTVMTITVNPIPPVITVNAYAQLVTPTSNTGTLHVAGEQNGTDANLTYTWSIISQPSVDVSGLNVGAPAGSPAPLAIFAINGTNAAKNTPVTFLASGQYVLQVVASNGVQSVTSLVQVTAHVNPRVTPQAVAESTTVSGVQAVSSAGSITGFVVTFNGPVDPTTAQNVDGYRILRPYTVTGGRSFWQELFGESPETQTKYAAYKIASAVYNPQTFSVTLTLESPMPIQDGTRLVEVLGTGRHAVLDANGKAVDGNSNGKPGGNFTYRFSMSVAKTFSYQTTAGDRVKLSLSGPGKIAAILPSGSATPVIDLIDNDPAESILTGSIRKSKKSLGYVVLDQINGTADADIQLGNDFHVNVKNAA